MTKLYYRRVARIVLRNTHFEIKSALIANLRKIAFIIFWDLCYLRIKVCSRTWTIICFNSKNFFTYQRTQLFFDSIRINRLYMSTIYIVANIDFRMLSVKFQLQQWREKISIMIVRKRAQRFENYLTFARFNTKCDKRDFEFERVSDWRLDESSWYLVILNDEVALRSERREKITMFFKSLRDEDFDR